MEQTLIHFALASVSVQPASEKRLDIAVTPLTWTPLLHPDKVLAPHAAPDSFADRPLRGFGSLAGAEVFACKQFGNDVRRQIMFLCEGEFVAATGRRRHLGFARRAAIRRTLLHFIDILNACADQSGEDSLRLRNTSEFGAQHLLAILGWFVKEKTKRSTIHNQLSILRKFLTLLGRRHLVPSTDELALLVIEHDISLDFGGRSYTAYVPLAWSAIVDLERVLQNIQRVDRHAHLLCQLCLLFGLRLTEALALRPVQSDLGNRLWVHRGCKGGRERWIPLSADPERRAQQREVLEQAKAACGGDRCRHLGFGDRTLEQARKHFEKVLGDCGVTQRQLGVKLHGLRHEYAVRRFLELTGLPAPVLRQAPLSAYASRMPLVRQAREQIAAELGHGRVSVVSAYIGSLPTLREEARQTELAGQIIRQHSAELEQIGVAAVTVAVRKVAARRHTYAVYVQPADAGYVAGDDDSLIARVRGFARSWLGRKVDAVLVPAPAQAGTVTVSVKDA
jgi:integrase